MEHERYIETKIEDYISPQCQIKPRHYPKKHIIILNGYGGSGKDTFCDMLSHLTEVKHVSVITGIKKIAKLLGWDGEKTEAGRKLLSDLKIAADKYNSYSWRGLLDDIASFRIHPTLKILAIDMREEEQIKETCERFNAKTVLVYNPRVTPIKSNPADENVLAQHYDYTIVNDGTLQDLATKAEDFLKRLEEDDK